MAVDGGGTSPVTTRITFDARVYALPAVKKAAYRFLKTFSTEITHESDAWVCTLTFAAGCALDEIDRTEREFRAEVLDHDLRASIARETEPVRNAILAVAFSRTGLQGSE